MPVYKVTDPDSGRSVKLTGDSPPTEAELSDIFANLPESANQPQKPIEGIPTAADMPEANIPEQESMSALDTAIGAADIATKAVTGMGEQAIAGIGGTLEALNPFATEGAGARQSEAIQQAIPDFEMGAQGQEIIGSIAEKYNQDPLFIKTIIDEVSGLGASLGESTFRATGSPLAATAVQMIPAALESVSGMRAPRALAAAGEMADIKRLGTEGLPPPAVPASRRLQEGVTKNVLDPASIKALEMGAEVQDIAGEVGEKAGEVVGQARGAVQSLSEKKRDIREALEAGEGGKLGAGYDLGPQGQITSNKLEQAALSEGWTDGTIGMLKNASPKDKAAASEMLDIRWDGMQNDLKKALDRPARVAGNSLLERYNIVRKDNRVAGSEVGAAARGLEGVQVNSDAIVDNFALDMSDRLGVKMAPDGTLDFYDSVIEKNTTARRVLTDISDIVGRVQNPDAARLHRVKKIIDDQVTYGKAKDGLAGETENILKALRVDVNNAIKDASPEYAAANAKYSETIGALDEFQGLMGKKVDLTADNAGEAVGKSLRKIMSNYGDREARINSITEIERIATKYGGEFNDNIILQAVFAQKLDDMFGAVADTSLRGTVAGGAVDAALGNPLTAAANVTRGVLSRKKKQNDKKSYGVMKELLK